MKLRSNAARYCLSAVSLLVLAAASCSAEDKSAPETKADTKPIERDPKYPAQWWAPVSKDGAPAWEVLPQEAGLGEVILSKRNKDLGLLSNFAPTPFTFHGKKYASLEGFWQAMKYPEGPDDERAKAPGVKWPHSRAEVEQMTAFDARHAGDDAKKNMEAMGINWVTFEGNKMDYRTKEKGDHYKLIVAAMEEKVRQNPEVKKVLLSTGDLKLRADHHPEADAGPAWAYYDILMDIRGTLQSGEELKGDK